jgi:hypothetical protein
MVCSQTQAMEFVVLFVECVRLNQDEAHWRNAVNASNVFAGI